MSPWCPVRYIHWFLQRFQCFDEWTYGKSVSFSLFFHLFLLFTLYPSLFLCPPLFVPLFLSLNLFLALSQLFTDSKTQWRPCSLSTASRRPLFFTRITKEAWSYWSSKWELRRTARVCFPPLGRERKGSIRAAKVQKPKILPWHDTESIHINKV